MTQSEVTRLLGRWKGGDAAAMDQLLPLVYEELRRIARAQMKRERPDHTMTPTALVHEAYLNLAGQEPLSLQDRAHFFAIASRVMRRVLIWYARHRNAEKRGSGVANLKLDDVPELAIDGGADRLDDLITLNDALEKLEVMDERLCRVVECRYFGGLTVEETSDVLGISPATTKRDWKTAKAWLLRELRRDDIERRPGNGGAAGIG